MSPYVCCWVAFVVKSQKVAARIIKEGIRAGGIKYRVERYIETGPDTLCRICARWGHADHLCTTTTQPRCVFCAGGHATEEHKCLFAGCEAVKGSNCKHTKEKCVNCKGAHIASSYKCEHKKAAFGKAKEERKTFRMRRRQAGNATDTEEDEEEGQSVVDDAEEGVEVDDEGDQTMGMTEEIREADAEKTAELGARAAASTLSL
jgi:hypothetical protein